MKSKIFILLILMVQSVLVAGSDIKVISSSESSLIFDYYPQYTSITEVSHESAKFLRVELKDGYSVYSNELGKPDIQFKEVLIGVPSENGYTIQVLNADYTTRKGNLIPVYNPYTDENNLSAETEIYKSEIINELVLPGTAGLFRDQMIGAVKLYPVQFNQTTGEVKLYNKIRVKVNFNAGSAGYTKLDDELSEDLILNYSVAKNWGIKRSDALNKANRVAKLGSGSWYKFEAKEEGFYRINRDQLNALGIDAGSVDPRTIKIYNNGGYQISEDIINNNPRDLVEVAIKVVGEDDGSFDSGDYILFYGRGLDFFETSNGVLKRNRHQYDTKNWFWITSGGTNGSRISDQPSVSSSDFTTQTTTDACYHLEENNYNIYKSGRLFLGDEFTTSEQSKTYISPLANYVSGTQVNYTINFTNHSRTSYSFRAEESGTTIYSGIAGGGNSAFSEGRENDYSLSYDGTISEERSVLKLTFSTNDAQANGFLDFYEITYKSHLRPVDDLLVFYGEQVINDLKFELSGFTNSDIKIYDVSDYSQVKEITGASISGSQATFTFTGNFTNRSKYIAVCVNKYKSISGIEKVNNSYVKAETQGAGYIIITSNKFKDQADRLAAFRSDESLNHITSKVFYVDEIYNEYSGGVVDITAIRDFLIDAYENWTEKPECVLFFGDGNYDFFNVESDNENYVPSWQTNESMNEVYSYSSDDYFCRISGNDRFIDLAHGRLPVNSTADAEAIVDKIIAYENNEQRGLWSTRIALVTDDHLKERELNEGNYHNRQAETLSSEHIPGYFNLSKIYLAAYPTVYTGAGRRKPDVNRAIIDVINNGVLMMNFIGHGNPKTWTHEYVFEKATTIPQIDNDNLFFLTAATCDFGRFDDPSQISSNEEMLFTPNKGMIGSLAATRSVFAGLNARYVYGFYDKLLGERDSENKPRRIGIAYLYSKISEYVGTDENSEKFHLFADPALTLSEPSRPANISSINGISVDTTAARLKALQAVEIRGSVNNYDGSLDAGYNGEAIISVFDSKKNINIPDLGSLEIDMPGGVIFRGRASVVNGEFSSGFTVPKDISYDVQNGKVVAYVFSENKDGIGYTGNVTFGGADTTVQNDGSGPDINISFDNSATSASYLVNNNFTLNVQLSDETGLNTTGTGIGHKLEAILNDDNANPIDLTDFFIGDLNAAGKSGVVEYKFSSMDPGEYSIKIKAWDVFNNFTAEETYFTVVDGNGLVLKDVANYPNPFSGDTHFTFQHNYADLVNVKINVYTVAGRKIREFEEFGITDKFVKVYWDGRDEDGDVLANGTYLYKLIVETVTGDVTENYLGKLAIIR